MKELGLGSYSKPTVPRSAPLALPESERALEAGRLRAEHDALVFAQFAMTHKAPGVPASLPKHQEDPDSLLDDPELLRLADQHSWLAKSTKTSDRALLAAVDQNFYNRVSVLLSRRKGPESIWRPDPDHFETPPVLGEWEEVAKKVDQSPEGRTNLRRQRAFDLIFSMHAGLRYAPLYDFTHVVNFGNPEKPSARAYLVNGKIIAYSVTGPGNDPETRVVRLDPDCRVIHSHIGFSGESKVLVSVREDRCSQPTRDQIDELTLRALIKKECDRYAGRWTLLTGNALTRVAPEYAHSIPN
jgi:hypothetical protein